MRDGFVTLHFVYLCNPDVTDPAKTEIPKKVSELTQDDVYLCEFSVRASHVRAVTVPHKRIGLPLAKSLIYFADIPQTQAIDSPEEVLEMVKEAEKER